MNIYIYGDNDFKQEVHSILDHTNARLYLGDEDVIEDIDSVEALKMAITEYPDDIFLIEDSKIIKTSDLNKTITFLKPKGAIEQSFLDEYSAGNPSFKSVKALVKHIKERFEKSSKYEKKATKEEFVNIEDISIDAMLEAVGGLEVQANGANKIIHIEYGYTKEQIADLVYGVLDEQTASIVLKVKQNKG